MRWRDAAYASSPRPVLQSQLAAIGHDHLLRRGAAARANSLDSFDHVHALDNLAKDHMLTIEVTGLRCAKEELGTVRIGAGVGHGENALSGVIQLEVLVLELLAIDGLSASAVMVRE